MEDEFLNNIRKSAEAHITEMFYKWPIRVKTINEFISLKNENNNDTQSNEVKAGDE